MAKNLRAHNADAGNDANATTPKLLGMLGAWAAMSASIKCVQDAYGLGMVSGEHSCHFSAPAVASPNM